MKNNSFGWHCLSIDDGPVRSWAAGAGGKVSQLLRSKGVERVQDLRRWTLDMLAAVGLSAKVAAQLMQWSRGEDHTPVQDRGPPKSLQVTGPSTSSG